MSLTESARKFRSGLKLVFVAAFVYYIVILLVIPTGKKMIAVLFPPKNPPTVTYGLLDPLTFEPKPINSKTPRYSLNTTDGKLPTGLPNRMYVYKIKDHPFSFQSGKDAQKDAAFLGFNDSDLASNLKEDIYKWKKLSTGSTLEIDIRTKELSLFTDIPRNENAYPKGILDHNIAEKAVVNLFKAIWRYNDSLYPSSYVKIKFGTIYNGRLVQAKSTRDRQIAMTDIYRLINNYPIVGPDPSVGLLHAIVRNPTKDSTPLNYPIIEAHYWEIDTESNATYPILTVQEAWKALQENKAVITHVREKDYNPFEEYTPLNVDIILINNIYLAYYETNDKQQYLQPIYLFEGNFQTKGTEGGEITLYYPAIRGEWIKKVEME
ncbi:hypothetical protein JXA34_00530 [Patescibacteria group bacterium]|nr:hypothetical protein [Patescibacteria group bacterium]